MIHHLTLVADNVDVYILGQCLLVVADQLFYFGTEVDNILAPDHLQRQQQALAPVVLDVLSRFRVFTLDGGNVAQSYHFARGSSTDNGLCQVLFGIER